MRRVGQEGLQRQPSFSLQADSNKRMTEVNMTLKLHSESHHEGMITWSLELHII